MRRIGLCLLVISLTLPAAASAELNPSRPERQDVSSERLDRIDETMDKAIKNAEVAGAVALVARNGRVVYHKAFGMADIAAGKPMKTNSIFRIASMTKAITTVAAMILYEEGAFLLNDPLGDYIPAFREMSMLSPDGAADDETLVTVPATKPIRIIDLMTHMSGISYPFIKSPLQKQYKSAGVIDGLTSKAVTLADQMALLAQQPLLFEPGSRFAYGLNTDLLGYLVEVISGQSLAEFVAERITGPLDMQDTHFYLPDSQADRLATLYAHVAQQGLVVSDGTESIIKLDNPLYPVAGAKTYFSGGAGMSSTALDYARFIQMLLNDGKLGETRIVSRKSVELMRAARADLDGDANPDFGLGFRIIDDLGRTGELGSVAAYSWGGAFYTSYWIDPQENLIAVLMTQTRPAVSDLQEKFNNLVYQALE